VTYATTLAFYLHLAALPPSTRPDLSNHPIIPRLFELKKGVSDLEELDFAAGSEADSDPILDSLKESFGLDPNEELTPEKKLAFMDWLQKQRGSGGGMGDMDEDEDDEDEDDGFDFDEAWKGAGLEEDELDDLLADAEDEDMSSDEVEALVVKPKKVKKSKTKGDESGKKTKSKKSKDKEVVSEPEPTPIASFTPLAEPAFKSSKSKKSHSLSADDDTLGDATSLLDADASDKERRTKSLRFHTSKIASTSNRRAAARAQRLGGDEDVPYRDRQKARDAALRKNSGGQDGGEDLDGTEWTESDKKRAREVRDEAGDDLGDGDGEGVDDGAGEYYDLVKRRKTEKIEEKEAAHEARQAEKLYVHPFLFHT
jgi:U3 small nucleolar RNA-associated protein 3